MWAGAYGLAHRGWSIRNTLDTRFGIASGTKAMTALTVVTLIEEGQLDLATTARSQLGADLPLIDDAVTVQHLLAHRSGIGDYFDETAVQSMTDYVMPVPVHRLVTTEDYLSVLDGHRQVFAPGTRFAYNNGAYVVLALLAERASGMAFHELVSARVCEPAGMQDTKFLRSDEPDGRTAAGYLDRAGLRTNVLHLPVRGSGDGGICTTAADVAAGQFGCRGWGRRRSVVPLRPRSRHRRDAHGAVQHDARRRAGITTPQRGASHLTTKIGSRTPALCFLIRRRHLWAN